MKNLCAVLGYASLLWMWLTGISYWAMIWGPIGFFGSILTTPFSQTLAIMMMMFSSVDYFIQMAVWIGVTCLLFAYASKE